LRGPEGIIIGLAEQLRPAGSPSMQG
jgi:hypothetical protein